MQEFSHLLPALRLFTSHPVIDLYTLPREHSNPALQLRINHLDDMSMSTTNRKLYSTRLMLSKAKAGKIELRGKFQSGVYFKIKLRWTNLQYPDMICQGRLYLGGLDEDYYRYDCDLGIFL